MQILSAEKMRAWDEFTILHEPVRSIDLMERAAEKCVAWLLENGYEKRSFTIFCGKGNNGGDGMAIARMLSQKECPVLVYILEFGHLGTDDFQENLARLHKTTVELRFIQSEENFHPIRPGDLVIDALYGSGLNRPLTGVIAALVDHMNRSGNTIISIDIPTGMFGDKSSIGGTVIRAKDTLAFQNYKLAFLVSENGQFTGRVHLLDIGLHPDFPALAEQDMEWVDIARIKSIFKPRDPFANKGNFGHALLVAGSYGKMGAAVLSARACLRSGAGLLSIRTPKCGYEILQVSVPEAMVSVDEEEQIHANWSGDASRYNVIGIGPGLGTEPATANFLRTLFGQYKKPMVLDADALNIISANPDLWKEVPPHSILTPHPKEFERLFGASANDFERILRAKEKASAHQCVIVLKGHYTFIATPDGYGFFNGTGNAGMAKGGTGDALTGIITALLAQGYRSTEAAILGVYIHGLAGDRAASYYSKEAMLSSDIIDCLGEAFLTMQ